jgi:ankyrin repeat protein
MLRLLLLTAAVLSAADTRLADAAQQGNIENIRALLKQKADVNAPQGDGSTALHWAAQKDDVEMAKLLLAGGANVKATTRLGAATPLFMAAKNGNAAMIDLLIKSGAEPNSADEHGTTPLMFAAASGNAGAVRTLIDHGAAVNAREGAHGQTALMFAAALGRVDAIKVLTASGADPSITSKAVKLAKIPSSFDDQSKPEPPKEDHKAQADALAASLGFKSAQYRPDKVVLSDKKPQNDDQMRPPRERGAGQMGGMTALLFAARDGHQEAARALLEAGANVNQISPADKTSPIVMAVANGHLDLAKFLLDYGADPDLSNDLGLTPLYAAIDVQWAPKGWFPSPILAQEQISYLDLMTALLDAGANPNARITKKLWFRASGDHSWIDPAGATPFWRAAQSLDIAAMKLLLKYNADPDIPSTAGATPLMVACGIGWGYHYSVNSPEYSWMDAVKFLMQLGPDVNAADNRGYTPLHGAAYLGNHEMIQYLIDHGADIKAVAKDKNTVADMANGPTRFAIPHPETVAMLEKLGSVNSHNCRAAVCLVNPKEDKKPTSEQQ